MSHSLKQSNFLDVGLTFELHCRFLIVPVQAPGQVPVGLLPVGPNPVELQPVGPGQRPTHPVVQQI